MYYESISHQLLPVANATEAATKIKNGSALRYHAISWQNENGKFYVVDDAHIDSGPFAEAAVIKEIDSNLFQVESITCAWIKTPKELANYFKEAETEEPIKRKTHLIIGKPTTQTAWFDCGCCGTDFKSNVAYQLKFDQDSGYGICPACERYYK